MKFKKNLIVLTAALCLMGCTSGAKGTGTVKPMATTGDLKGSMPEETYKIMSNVYGESFLNQVNMLKYTGTDVTDLSFTTKAGAKLTYADLKGKKVAIEVIANWCEYCKTEGKEYIDEIYEKNKDTVFVQMFAEGTSAEIDEFYKSIGKEQKANYIIPASEEVKKFIDKIGVNSFPTFAFVDESGKLAWTYSGILDNNQFTRLKDVAFAKKKIYETYDDKTLKLADLTRNAKDIEKDLSDDAKKIIKKVETDEALLEVLYSNLGRNWMNAKLTDVDDKTLDFSKLKGENFVFEILNTDEKNFTGSLTSIKNMKDDKNKKYKKIQLWLPADEKTDVKKYIKDNEIAGTADYIVPLNEKNNIPELGDIAVFNFPTQFYINKDFKIAGVTQGALTPEKYTAATEAFFGKTPLYEMAMKADKK